MFHTCLTYVDSCTESAWVLRPVLGPLIGSDNLTNIFQMGWNHQLDLSWRPLWYHHVLRVRTVRLEETPPIRLAPIRWPCLADTTGSRFMWLRHWPRWMPLYSKMAGSDQNGPQTPTIFLIEIFSWYGHAIDKLFLRDIWFYHTWHQNFVTER